MGFLPTDEGLPVAARIWQRMNDPIPGALQALACVESGPHRAAQYQRLADAWLRFAPEEREGSAPAGPLSESVRALQRALQRERDVLLADIGDQPYYRQ